MALEDAVVLARALRDAGGYVAAGTAAYELARRDRVERIVAAGRHCLDEDGADAIVLGCMSMAFLPGVARSLQEKLGCPVINPVLAALKTAEMSATLGLGMASRSQAPQAEAAE